MHTEIHTSVCVCIVVAASLAVSLRMYESMWCGCLWLFMGAPRSAVMYMSVVHLWQLILVSFCGCGAFQFQTLVLEPVQRHIGKIEKIGTHRH